jgi:thiol:disulfide interchange protein DsbC
MVPTLRLWLLGLLSAVVSCALAAEPASVPDKAKAAEPASVPDKAKADPRVALASKIPGTHPEDLRPSPVPGIYELTRGADLIYVTTDGKFAFVGDLYDLPKNANLTEEQRKTVRVKMISAIPESQMVIFGPKTPRYTVTVFTDVDCAYCRQLHSQIAEYNRLGVRVRYIFYPRSGPDTESWTKAEQVWCSPDRNDALTRAKLGQALKAKPCADNPVAREYALGKDFQLEGTPAIVLADGELVPGYMPPDMLVKHLKESEHR